MHWHCCSYCALWWCSLHRMGLPSTPIWLKIDCSEMPFSPAVCWSFQFVIVCWHRRWRHYWRGLDGESTLQEDYPIEPLHRARFCCAKYLVDGDVKKGILALDLGTIWTFQVFLNNLMEWVESYPMHHKIHFFNSFIDQSGLQCGSSGRYRYVCSSYVARFV